MTVYVDSVCPMTLNSLICIFPIVFDCLYTSVLLIIYKYSFKIIKEVWNTFFVLLQILSLLETLINMNA